ncbi:AAA family ATPase [Sphingomonas qomolangmaensis]|uniref:AAA family ATPase n=1 Tax=Sphingomonas qomolangmaensis TaxID=2918765 RepID=A0ABY5LBX7_9SPHN|nr:AAA family ATPase [Sphingomonas qomolangmaensis]UUL83234.1 AAA family ATPase [Sphingomonas qomolangmaensis]
MNDQTPGRFKGTLLERAAKLYDYAPLPPLEPATAPPRRAEMPPAPAFDPEPSGFTEAEHYPAFVPDRRFAAIDPVALGDKGLLVPGAPVTPLAEEYRLVKRQLLANARGIAGDQARAILVCSAKPGDGKTFTAINLALSLAAEKDVEILLVDADIAKPDVLQTLGIDEGPGLLDAIGDPQVAIEGCIVETDVANLTVLPAGTRGHADTELLASARARTLIEGLVAADPRRIVVFDSPPALAASPAGVLATLVGQVVVVVRADRTSEADLRDAVAALDGCEHVQLILNGVTLRPGGPRLGDYYGYGATE